MDKRKINQKDIAESLKLSVATVSKALRGDYSDVNSQTRDRVVNRASQLGYEFGSRKQQAILDEEETKSYMVGVLILRKLHEWQHTNYFAGMTEKCAKLNVSLILHYVNEENSHLIFDKEHQPPAMRDGELSGLILVNHWPQEVVGKLTAQMPCVSIQHAYPRTRMDIIGVDDAQGIERLMEHLYSLGHRKIGFFGNCGQVYNARMRFAAYISTLAELNLELDIENVIDVKPENLEDKEIILSGQIESVNRRIQQGVRAWICASDWVGYLLCRGLIDRGYDIPKDVSIVGFDDSEDNTLGCPKLTSITVPALRIGAEALRRLINRVKHPSSPPLKVMLPCKLFEAQTTSPPPKIT
ncbi:MAG: LacI family DNA-binding transcriptional regulator [Planctomycetes bacterium]|nr:LacI family DNA-binding transcriptional regulator [Planctomycetota bacterium]